MLGFDVFHDHLGIQNVGDTVVQVRLHRKRLENELLVVPRGELKGEVNVIDK